MLGNSKHLTQSHHNSTGILFTPIFTDDETEAWQGWPFCGYPAHEEQNGEIQARCMKSKASYPASLLGLITNGSLGVLGTTPCSDVGCWDPAHPPMPQPLMCCHSSNDLTLLISFTSAHTWPQFSSQGVCFGLHVFLWVCQPPDILWCEPYFLILWRNLHCANPHSPQCLEHTFFVCFCF